MRFDARRAFFEGPRARLRRVCECYLCPDQGKRVKIGPICVERNHLKREDDISERTPRGHRRDECARLAGVANFNLPRKLGRGRAVARALALADSIIIAGES